MKNNNSVYDNIKTSNKQIFNKKLLSIARYISLIIIVFCFLYLAILVKALREENKSLNLMATAYNTSYYLAKTPVLDSQDYIDRSGYLVTERNYSIFF